RRITRARHQPEQAGTPAARLSVVSRRAEMDSPSSSSSSRAAGARSSWLTGFTTAVALRTDRVHDLGRAVLLQLEHDDALTEPARDRLGELDHLTLEPHARAAQRVDHDDLAADLVAIGPAR